MTERNKGKDDAGNLATIGAAYAIGGPVLAGAVGLGALTGDGPKNRDLGPEPIGSDPWLVRNVREALEDAKLLDGIKVHAQDAVVTLRGAEGKLSQAEEAARTVQGIKKLHVLP